MKKSKTRVFIFGGENTKFAFSAGAAKALEDASITADICVGNSGGSLLAWWISHQSAREAYDYTYNIKNRGAYLRFNWRRLFWDGLYDPTPLFKVLEDVKSEPQKIPSYYATTNHKQGSFKLGTTINDCIASICEPVWIRSPDGVHYDGGNMSQVPNTRVFDKFKGDEYEFFVFLNNPIRDSIPGNAGSNVLSILLRGVDIQTHESFMDDYRLIMHEPRVKAVFAPSQYLYKPFTFDRFEIRRALHLGEAKAKKWLNS